MTAAAALTAAQQRLLEAWPHRTPEGTRVYAVGDVHGRDDLLQSLIDTIAADARERGSSNNVLVFLGDLVDRGPQSAAVIERLSTLRVPGFEIVTLCGNHDSMFRESLVENRTGKIFGRWYSSGGAATLESYGVRPSTAMFTEAVARDLYAQARQRIPAHHLGFLSALRTSWTCGDYLFVHAGLRPGVALADQTPHDMMWIRDGFVGHRERFEKLVVHGHSVTYEPEVLANRIGIDTGAYKTGRLSAVALEGRAVRFLST